MNRDAMISHLRYSPDVWDFIIIGGGATGLGVAVDAASRGYSTLLLEQSDFAKATSSRSTKLIHGGLRYLKQGHIALVKEALEERGLLCRNAPHLVHHLPFLIPEYSWWEKTLYSVGLFTYDFLAGELGIEKSNNWTKEKVIEKFPNLQEENLKGGTLYYDGQFDDARLAITLAKTAAHYGAVVTNYTEVTELLKKNEKVSGVVVKDLMGNNSFVLHGRAIINATGIFTDEIRKKDNPKRKPLLFPSQGIHIAVDKSFLDDHTSIIIPKTDDNRVIFMVPWFNRLLIGTTDIGGQKPTLEPIPKEDEIDFLLKHAKRYLKKAPKKEDIRSIFAGLRPLVQEKGKDSGKISRNHKIEISSSGLITICGGKWTTYRKMAEDLVDKAIEVKNLPALACITKDLPLYGNIEKQEEMTPWSEYGSESTKLAALVEENAEWGLPLHEELPYCPAEIIWGIREEMACGIEDLLARRTRALFLDAKASIEIAPKVAKIFANELGYDGNWERKEVERFTTLAQNYLA